MKQHHAKGITRRGFLVGAGMGLVVGAPLGWLALKGWPHSLFSGQSQEVANPEFAMPGPFPGRVIEVRHPGAVSDQHVINASAVRQMMGHGMCELTGADHPQEAWRRFFNADDIVGVKVNPVGQATSSQPVGSISSPAVLIEVVQGLKSAGVRPHNIIIFERYADAMRSVYGSLRGVNALSGVKWYASSAAYTNTQLAIDGHDGGGNDPEVIGYDPDVFVEMGFAHDDHSQSDDRRFRSHLSAIVTRMVNKIVTIPCLKDHRSAGVTLALKNMSHGMNNNVARSHLSGINHAGGSTSNPNQCNTFIPHAVNQTPLRQKATLHILDGLIGVYEGGPGNWNPTWATWRRKSLFFATDPVAMDHVCWEIIDSKRLLEGWLPVAQMSMFDQMPAHTFSPRLAAAAALGGPEAAVAALGEHHHGVVPQVNEFDRRQPEHVILASTLGLGVWDANQIDHRVFWLDS
jgi:uncharacterized protein (DUF362 family)